MNCLNCDNTGYRRLCNYDDETYTCTNNQQYSFDCVTTGYGNNKQCVPLPIGQGRYKTMGECQQSCDIQPPVGEISYQCVDIGYGKDKGGKECIPMYNRPNIEQGRFSTMGECQRSCAIPVTPVTPVISDMVGVQRRGVQRMY